MEHFQQLRTDLESISLSDISEKPIPHQYVIADRIEQLHDALRDVVQRNNSEHRNHYQ